jgi:UDP-3-O-[3-hydroxymyristoyl] glucosamine N-acyltransferase
VKLHDIARLLNAELLGDGEKEISRVAKIEEAGRGDLTFLANPKYFRHLQDTRASAVIVGKGVSLPAGRGGEAPALLRVADPYAAFVHAVVAFHPPKEPVPPGIHGSAVIDPSARLADGVRVAPCVVIGPGCSVGARTMLGPGTVLGEGVRVGEDCLFHGNVTVREGCIVGSRVILQPGAVIGGDGFGFAPQPDGSFEKIPQIGIVVLEDDVEIGANTTVDRATLGETRVRRGTKLDNLIQVAHNVVIGENTVSAAQAGISGSTKIGKNVMIGGQVGFTGHLEIADGTKVGAQSGVHRSVHTPDTVIFGTPAMPQREAFHVQGAIVQLPELLKTVRALQNELEELKRRLGGDAPSGSPDDRSGTV